MTRPRMILTVICTLMLTGLAARAQMEHLDAGVADEHANVAATMEDRNPEKRRSRRDMDFVVNVLPAALLIQIESDSFNANGTDLSKVFAMPNFSMGVGIEFEHLYLDVTAGAGALVTEEFRSFMLQLDVAAYWEPFRSFFIGPHLGIVNFPDPDWLSNDDVEFDGTTGLMGGIRFSMGDKITYLVSLDIMNASFKRTDMSDSDDLDLLAFAIQFGVRGQF